MATKAKGKSRKPTATQRIDAMESTLGAIAQHLGLTGDAEQPAETPAPEQQAAPTPEPTRTVRLPELKMFRKERRAIGVDATYTSNIALFRLNSEGSPVAKKDGGIKKPTRIRVEDAEFLLSHAKEVKALCAEIRANQQPAE